LSCQRRIQTVGVERERREERGSDDKRGGESLTLFPFFFFCLLFFFQLSPGMVLATEPGIWIPAVVLGHLIGICFLLYSLEKTNGSVSRLWKRMTIRSKGKGADDGASVGAAAGSAAPIKLMRGMSADNEPLHYERAPRWVRGCTCKVNRVEQERGREREREIAFATDCLGQRTTVERGTARKKKKSRRALGPSRPLYAALCSQLPSVAIQ